MINLSSKNKILLFVVIIVLGAGLVRLFSGEDDWICENGQWQAHGRPSAAKPTTGCGQAVNQTPPLPAILNNTNVKDLNITIDQEIASPLTITGQIRGIWFFEASFPVMLTDWDGKIIAQGIAKAKGDWMTENFVPFEATLTFVKPEYKNTGTLILKKDNPSNLPQNDAAIEIPIKFK